MSYTAILLNAFLPLLLAVAGSLRRFSGQLLAGLGVGVALVQLLSLSAFLYLENGESAEALDGWLRLDPLSCLFSLVTALCAASAVLYEGASSELSEGRGTNEEAEARAEGLLRVRLGRLFWLWATAALVPLMSGFTSLWGAMVALSLAVAGALRGSSFEAARRYSLRSWLALSLSLFGALFLFWGALRATSKLEEVLAFSTFFDRASSLDDLLLCIGAALSLAGYGFLAGLWPGGELLLESFEEASRPKSFFLSTAIWGVALYAILRVVGLCAKATGFDFPSSMLVWVGGLTALASLWQLPGETDAKRFLWRLMGAHTGLFFFGLGFSSRFAVQSILAWAIFLLLARGLLWLSVGLMMARRQSSTLSQLEGEDTRGPWWSLALSLAAALGLFPFVTFVSQWTTFSALAAVTQKGLSSLHVPGVWGSVLWGVSAWKLLLFSFFFGLWVTALIRVGFRLLFGKPYELPAPSPTPRGFYAALGLLVLALLVLGLYLPKGVDDLFDQSARIIIGEWSDR